LNEFEPLFEVPMDLLPSRACDRHAPALKDEIERQLQDMLSNGIIQPSASPFSSSVLLFKKKDGSWQFSVDYRHLNGITVKGKYLVPVIDELLDELVSASWFSKLDLRAGFHQIRRRVQNCILDSLW
jgi:hypothetical protein